MLYLQLTSIDISPYYYGIIDIIEYDGISNMDINNEFQLYNHIFQEILQQCIINQNKHKKCNVLSYRKDCVVSLPMAINNKIMFWDIVKLQFYWDTYIGNNSLKRDQSLMNHLKYILNFYWNKYIKNDALKYNQNLFNNFQYIVDNCYSQDGLLINDQHNLHKLIFNNYQYSCHNNNNNNNNNKLKQEFYFVQLSCLIFLQFIIYHNSYMFINQQIQKLILIQKQLVHNDIYQQLKIAQQNSIQKICQNIRKDCILQSIDQEIQYFHNYKIYEYRHDFCDEIEKCQFKLCKIQTSMDFFMLDYKIEHLIDKFNQQCPSGDFYDKDTFVKIMMQKYAITPKKIDQQLFLLHNIHPYMSDQDTNMQDTAHKFKNLLDHESKLLIQQIRKTLLQKLEKSLIFLTNQLSNTEKNLKLCKINNILEEKKQFISQLYATKAKIKEQTGQKIISDLQASIKMVNNDSIY